MKFEYSIDMLRIEAKVNGIEFAAFMNGRTCYQKEDIKHYDGFAYSGYRHLWRVEGMNPFDLPFSYAIMFQHNMERPSMYHKLVIEYNPNKVMYNGFLRMLMLRFFTPMARVVQLDIACDVDIDISSINYINTGKQYISTIDSPLGKTIYFGKRGCGQIKVYDKAKELDLEHQVLTRIEKTVKVDCPVKLCYGLSFDDEDFPDLFYSDDTVNRLDSNMNAVDRLVILGLKQRPDLINQLSYYQKHKYTELLHDKKIALDTKEMSKALCVALNNLANVVFGYDIRI
jgi:hypothetical protein